MYRNIVGVIFLLDPIEKTKLIIDLEHLRNIDRDNIWGWILYKISQIVRPFCIFEFSRIFSFLKGKGITKKLTKIAYISLSRLQRINIIRRFIIYIYIYFCLNYPTKR